MPIPRIWYRYSPSPPPALVNVVQSGTEMIHTDFSIVFLGGGGISSAFRHGNIHFA